MFVSLNIWMTFNRSILAGETGFTTTNPNKKVMSEGPGREP